MLYKKHLTPFKNPVKPQLPQSFMSREEDLDPRPTVYKTVALPLSYPGKK
jgi:hypothetical protein